MSKVGVQSQAGVIQDALRLAAKHPVAWKLLGNALSLDFARQLRAIYPNIVIVLRAQPDNWSLDAGVVDYANRAMRVAQPFLNEGLCDFLEPPNEPVVWNDVDARRLNDQMVQIASIYKNNGYRTLAYQFSVGNPDYPLWQYLNDGIIASDGWLGLHEYGSPSLQNDAGNLSLRHRNARTFMSPVAQGILKVAITEAFIDLGATGGHGGYRALPNPTDDDLWWIRNLTTQLDWWDGELARDAYVKFACGFGYAMEEPWKGLGFDIADVDTDRAFYIAWQKSGDAPIPPISVSHSASSSTSHSASASPSASHEDTSMQVYQPYAFPNALSNIAWQGIEGDATPNLPFYRIQTHAGVRLGVSAFAQLCVVNETGIPLAGVKVVNDFGDGSGELLQTDASGLVQFNFGPSSAFTPPAPPPLAQYVVDDNAWVEPDKPHTLHYTYKLSDILRSGDTNGIHTQGSATFVRQVVLPDAIGRDDAIRLMAYPSAKLTIPVYCRDCALQAEGRRRGLGQPSSDEFYVQWGNVNYVCQDFADRILVTIVGHYAPSDFFTVEW